MYCARCGTVMDDSNAFCPVCGQQTAAGQNANQQYQTQKNNIRQSEMAMLQDAISHFSQKSAQFEEYERVCGRVNYYGKGAKSALLVWGCIVLTICLIPVLILYSANDKFTVESVILLLPGLLMILGGILMKINNRRNYDDALERYTELAKELHDFCAFAPECYVGMEYLNPAVLVYLMRILQSGRADTIKESLNIALCSVRRGARGYLSTLQRHTASINRTYGIQVIFFPSFYFQ